MNNKNLDNWIRSRKQRRENLEAKTVYAGIQNQELKSLSQGITLIESSRPDHAKEAQKLIQFCLPHSGKSIRIGITGVPGVGKSTFIESFGKILVKKGKKVAVLAIDPSSSVSRGSILGDKTRMQDLSVDPNVFIRPSAAGETLGGVARKTRESILLCEAAGFDIIIIETVGVGQSETAVKHMVDFFLLLMLSGAGDELQGIKKGIMEMADALVITKADGENVKKANLASREYKNALHLFPPNTNGWIPEVFTCSSMSGDNIERVFDVLQSFENHVKVNGCFEKQRIEQDKIWLTETLKEMILSGFYQNDDLLKKLREAESKMDQGKLTSFQAAEELFKLYKEYAKRGV